MSWFDLAFPRRGLLLLAAFSVAMFATPTPVRCAEPSESFLALNHVNPHYFQWRGKPTVLVTSGEHYGAVLNLDFDYVTYLDELQRHGLNHTRTFSGVYRENANAFQISDNVLAPAPNRYVCPWARSDQPGYHGGGNRFDLTRWDDAYFGRLKDFVSEAGKRGIIVELTLFCPMYNDSMWDECPMKSSNNVNEIGKCGLNEVYTMKERKLFDVQLAVTRKIVNELREFGNLYYEVCNEPYFGGVTMPWQQAIVDAIGEAERDFSHQHLISLNVANGRQKIDTPNPGVSIFNFHYCVPPDTVAMNDGIEKVIGENETGFRGSEDLLYRTEGWDFLMAGGAIYNNLDYSFSTKHPDGSFVGFQSPGGGSVALRTQLGILKKFFDELDFIHMAPDKTSLQSVSPSLTTSVLARAGETFAVYLHVPIPEKPKRLQDHQRDDVQATLVIDLPAGDYAVQWTNTKTGIVQAADSLSHPGGRLTLQSPEFSNDLALRLNRRTLPKE